MAGERLRIALVAGELSGDQLGAALIDAIRRDYPKARFEGVAGPQMRAAGCHAVADVEALSVMGIAEVVKHLPRLLRLRKRLGRYFIAKPPDVFVGIDAPDFNLGLERVLKRHGIPTVHWVSPSVWAWRRKRLQRIRDSVDLMLTLFPFEERYYAESGIQAHCVGHPLADSIAAGQAVTMRAKLGLDSQRPCLTLLPGSRSSELKHLLEPFLQTAKRCCRQIGHLQLLLAVANPKLKPFCTALLAEPEFRDLPVKLLDGQALEAMQAADAVLLASGTATLECMLLQRPMVVAYRMHPFSYMLLKRMIKVPYVALPNLLLERAQVAEYLQNDATPERLADALLPLLQQPELAQRQVAPFAGVHEQLRRNAAAEAARYVMEIIAR